MTSRLASLLVQEGLVSPKRMAEAFQRQVIYGGTLDTILLEMDALDELVLLEGLGRASSLPTAGDLPSIEQLKAARVQEWFPLALCERFRAMPISLDGNMVRVLVVDPPDRKQLDELGYLLSRTIDPIIVPEHRFVHATSLLYDVAIPARFQSLQARLQKRATSRPVAEAPISRPTGESLPREPSFTSPASQPTPQPVSPPAAAPERFRRAVVTDVPMPTMRAQAAPVAIHSEEPTPRLLPREMGAPERPIEPAPAASSPTAPPHTSLSTHEAVAQIDGAADRDAIFSALCRGARAYVPFVTVLTIHGELAVGKMALADRWLERDLLARLSIAIDRSAPFRAAIAGRAPYLGRVGEDSVGGQALAALGRKAPMPAILLPIVLRDRAVALIYADCDGAAIDAAILGELTTLGTAATRSFQRLILRAKSGDFAQAPTNVADRAVGKLSQPSQPASPIPKSIEGAGTWRAATPREKPHTTQPRFGTALMQAVQASAPVALSTPASESIGHREPTLSNPASAAGVDLEPLLTSVMRGDEQARQSIEVLLSLGERAAELVVARMPGPLRLDRHRLRGTPPPVSDHGPLLALISRFGQRARSALLRRIGDPSLEVRYYATLALGELGGPEVVVALGTRLFDSDASVRAVAVDGLAHLPDSAERLSLIESLRGELPGPDALRQRLASEALGGLHDVPSVPRLIELVKHEEAAVVNAARRALIVITKQDFGTSRWRWRGWWERHRYQPRVEWMLEGLAHAEAEVRLSASEELKHLAPESFGYHFDLPKREREDARKRWIDWWRTHSDQSTERRQS